jgi:transcriptional regulator with XRE-family HTH domain
MPAKRKREDCVAFGKAVREFRMGMGVSQEDLADRTKIHRTYIGGIERGERNPTLTMIVRLAEALGASPHELLAKAEKNHR